MKYRKDKEANHTQSYQTLCSLIQGYVQEVHTTNMSVHVRKIKKVWEYNFLLKSPIENTINLHIYK